MSADVLKKPPLELALRAVLAFGIAVWCSIQFSPVLLQRLLPFYEQVVHQMDDHYRIDFKLTHETGHGLKGSDLVILGTATATTTFYVFGAGKAVPMYPGEGMRCSTAVGVFMAPAIMLVGLLLGWPAHSWRTRWRRTSFGTLALAIWMFLGIPLELWIYFVDLPIRAYSPNTVTFMTGVGKFLLNGGGVGIGTALSAGVIAIAGRQPTSAPPNAVAQGNT